MKDSDRLELLKEIAGTKVYEERKAESLKILNESGFYIFLVNVLTRFQEGKKQKIQETLDYIEQRLAELQQETEELKEYQQLDKERRALEYTIYDKEMNQTLAELNKIEEQRSQESDRASEIHAKAIEAHEQVRSVEKEIKSLSAQILQLNKEKEVAEEDRQEAIKEKAKLELAVRDNEGKLERERQAHVTIGILSLNIAGSGKQATQGSRERDQGQTKGTGFRST